MSQLQPLGPLEAQDTPHPCLLPDGARPHPARPHLLPHLQGFLWIAAWQRVPRLPELCGQRPREHGGRTWPGERARAPPRILGPWFPSTSWPVHAEHDLRPFERQGRVSPSESWEEQGREQGRGPQSPWVWGWPGENGVNVGTPHPTPGLLPPRIRRRAEPRQLSVLADPAWDAV